MLLTGFILISLYFVLVTLFLIGWKRIPVFNPVESGRNPVSVVVVCKNESTNLNNLLDALRKQSFPDFELILVDDHSDDNTYEMMLSAVNYFSNVKVLKSVLHGKKNALKCGIEQASSDRILTTDADCLPPARWIETMCSFQSANNADMVIGPVEIAKSNGIFNDIQHAEFQTLIASAAGMSALNRAIMCNGANLLFHKGDWLKNFPGIRADLRSGDDVFLLHNLKKQSEKIMFVKSADAVVQTKAPDNLRHFFTQRKRWASKSPFYRDSDTIITAIIILTLQIYLITLLIFSLLNISFLKFSLLLFTIKFCIDTLFIYLTSDILIKKITVKTILVLTVVYPFYIVYSALAGIFSIRQRYTYR